MPGAEVPRSSASSRVLCPLPRKFFDFLRSKREKFLGRGTALEGLGWAMAHQFMRVRQADELQKTAPIMQQNSPFLSSQIDCPLAPRGSAPDARICSRRPRRRMLGLGARFKFTDCSMQCKFKICSKLLANLLS